jgi:hypothetical protein
LREHRGVQDDESVIDVVVGIGQTDQPGGRIHGQGLIQTVGEAWVE